MKCKFLFDSVCVIVCRELVWRQDTPVENTGKLREELPKALLLQVSLEMHANMIDNSAFFALFEKDRKEYAFIGELLSSLTPDTSFEGEFIANIGQDANRWGIIHSGSIVGLSPLNKSLKLMIWMPGDSLGEIPIFLTTKW